METQKLMDIKQLSKYLNLKSSNIRRKILLNQIPYIKIGHLVRFDVDEINKWLTENYQKSKK